MTGHEQAVRALAARGRTLVSGSYDCTVRVWDIIDGTCIWTLAGHCQKGIIHYRFVFSAQAYIAIVYSVVLDTVRNQCCSGSMDSTVRIWNLKTGQCTHVLQGHNSLVGLLGLSPTHLVSAAADSTLRVWDPDTGHCKQILQAHTNAITCFQHDEFKVLSGSDGTLKMWDIRDGSVVRDLLTGITGVWQVVFDGRWCVAASNRMDVTYLDVWDFGGDDPEEDWVGELNSLSDDDDYQDGMMEEDGAGLGPAGSVSDMDVADEVTEDIDSLHGRPWNMGQPAGPSTRLVDRALTDAGLFHPEGRATRTVSQLFLPTEENTRQGSKSSSSRSR